MIREVTISLSEEFQDVTAKTGHHVLSAVGYLATWAMHGDSYSGKMSLYGDHEGNLNATYRNKTGEVTYNIFGLRDEDGRYSFHS